MSRRAGIIMGLAFGIPLLACVLAALVLLLVVGDEPESARPSSANVAAVASQETGVASIANDEAARIALYERTAPAVVSIETALNPPEQGAQMEPLAQGSGFIFDDEGHIVTNHHVVRDAKYIEVIFHNNQRGIATIVGSDEDSDLAVLKVDSDAVEGIAPLELADSSTIKVGQDAIAIGNPFGQHNTMTVGIISAVKGRALGGRFSGNLGQFRNTNILQSDAAINPGNSGGPLLNSQGYVIGVNTSISVSEAVFAEPSFEGVGYAVPSNTIALIVPNLINDGYHTYAYLGVTLEDVTPAVATQLGLSVQQGSLIMSVQPDTPAAKAGLRDADVVIAINDLPVLETTDLLSVINTSRVGETVILTIQRGDYEQRIEAILGPRP